jgi:hypothetical protein
MLWIEIESEPHRTCDKASYDFAYNYSTSPPTKRGGSPDYYDELEKVFTRGMFAFGDLLAEMADLHSKKDQDYATPETPFLNLREATELGLTAVDAALVRAGDKWRRVSNLHRRQKEGGVPANESKEDSLLDLAAYSLIAVILEREQTHSRLLGVRDGD